MRRHHYVNQCSPVQLENLCHIQFNPQPQRNRITHWILEDRPNRFFDPVYRRDSSQGRDIYKVVLTVIGNTIQTITNNINHWQHILVILWYATTKLLSGSYSIQKHVCRKDNIYNNPDMRKHLIFWRNWNIFTSAINLSNWEVPRVKKHFTLC